MASNYLPDPYAPSQKSTGSTPSTQAYLPDPYANTRSLTDAAMAARGLETRQADERERQARTEQEQRDKAAQAEAERLKAEEAAKPSALETATAIPGVALSAAKYGLSKAYDAMTSTAEPSAGERASFENIKAQRELNAINQQADPRVQGAPVRRDAVNKQADFLANAPQDIQEAATSRPGVEGRINQAALASGDANLVAPVIKQSLAAEDEALYAKTFLPENTAGLVEPGNIDLSKRPQVRNPDGSISTVRSASFNFDGLEVLLPTVSDDGKLLSTDETVAQFRKTGKHLGKFNTPAEATAYAEALHVKQAAAYSGTGNATRQAIRNKMYGGAVSDAQTLDTQEPNQPDAEGTARYWGDFESGVVGTTGASLSYTGRKVGAAELAELGDSMASWAEGRMPENATFSDKLVNAFGSMASFYVPGVGVTKGAQALSVLSPTLARWTGAGTMAGLEAAAEADGVFKTLKAQGQSDEQAMAEADKSFLANMALLGITNKVAFFNDIKMFDEVAGTVNWGGVAAKAGVGAAVEGPLQEAPQQFIQNYLTGRPITEGAGEAALIGAIAGGGAASIQGAIEGGNSLAVVQEINGLVAENRLSALSDESLSAVQKVAQQFNVSAPGAVDVLAVETEVQRRASLGVLSRASEEAARAADPINQNTPPSGPLGRAAEAASAMPEPEQTEPVMQEEQPQPIDLANLKTEQVLMLQPEEANQWALNTDPKKVVSTLKALPTQEAKIQAVQNLGLSEQATAKLHDDIGTFSPASVTFQDIESGRLPVMDDPVLPEVQSENAQATETTVDPIAGSAAIEAAETDLPDVGPQPVYADSVARVNAELARRADEIEAITGQRPPELTTASSEEEQAFAPIAEALRETFGTEVVPFSDRRPMAPDGLAYKGTTFINVGNLQRPAPFVAAHEFKHSMEQSKDAADREVAAWLEDSIMPLISEEGQREYAEKFLFKGMTLEQVNANPELARELRNEMTADFMAKRMTDRKFLKDLAARDPASFKGFVKKWVAAIDNLIESLKGKRGLGYSDVDKHIADLKKAKAIAQEAMVLWGANARARAEEAKAAQTEAATVTDSNPQFARKSDKFNIFKREKASGRFVGAPDWVGSSPEEVAKLYKKLKGFALEGESGKLWYEKSSKAVLDLVGGDKAEAEKFVGLLAIYSQGTEVSVNTGFALEAYYQWKAGLPIKTGRFPQQQTPRAEKWLNEGKDWGGIKTNNFYVDLMEEINPASVDEAHATMDMWMALAFDYGATKLDQGPKYTFAKTMTELVAEELGWKPHQVQAAVWTSIKTRVEATEKERAAAERKNGIQVQREDGSWTYDKSRMYDHFRLAHALGVKLKITPAEIAAKGFDFRDALNQRLVQMSWEATPSVTEGSLPGIHKAPYAQKLEYLSAVAKALTKDGKNLVAEAVGLHSPPTLFGVSAWEGATGAGAQSFFPAPVLGLKVKRAVIPVARKLLSDYAALLGLVLRQDAVGWHHPVYAEAESRKNGTELIFNRALTEKEVADLYLRVYNEFSTWRPTPSYTQNGAKLINFVEGLDNDTFQKGVGRVVESLPDVFGGGLIERRGFRSDGEIVFNDWKEHSDGERYKERLRARRPDILARAADLRARVETVNREFDKKYGWGGPKFSRKSGISASGLSESGVDGRGRETGRGVSTSQVQTSGRVRQEALRQEERLSKYAALPGAPSVPGINGPIPVLVDVAEGYARAKGLAFVRQSEYVELDESRAKRLADAYAAMPNAPSDPRVKEAYGSMIAQTKEQYQALVDAGFDFWFIDIETQSGRDYAASPWKALRDLSQYKAMGVFPTASGFGSDTEFDPSKNPLYEVTDIEWPYGSPTGPLKKVYANDLFRAVHDAFGHGLEGAGFRAQGEENAWQAHVRLYTGSAIHAMTTETRGQNSWVNFGPKGLENQTASAENTFFADQKVGLLPEWAWTEGVYSSGERKENLNGETEYENRRAGRPDLQSTPADLRASGESGRGLDTRGNEASGGASQRERGVATQVGDRRGGPGAVSVQGTHFSNQKRETLSGQYFGTGLKGAERDRVFQAKDSRLRTRLCFYVNEGKGVRPEAGVGGVAHEVSLENLYDTSTRKLSWEKDPYGDSAVTANNFESAVLDAGYDGYYRPEAFGTQGVAVLLGDAARSVKPKDTPQFSRKAWPEVSQLVMINEVAKNKKSWGRHLDAKHIQRVADESAEVFKASSGSMKLNALYLEAAKQKDAFDAFIEGLADLAGVQAETAVLKNRERTVEKAVADYKGDVGMLKDVLRATLVTESITEARQLFEVLSQSDLVADVKGALKNSLESGTDAGYRDAKVILNVNGVPAEVIIAPKALLLAKDVAHSMYERTRTLASGEVTEKVQAEIDSLNEKMAEIYLPAFQRAQSSSASLRVQGTEFSRELGVLSGRLSGSNANRGLNLNSVPSGISATGMPSKSKNLVPSGSAASGDVINESSKDNSIPQGKDAVRFSKKQTETPEFKKWFGDSKVVDEFGEPLVVYHGTNKSENGNAFSSFDTYSSARYGLMGQGSYFTDDPTIAAEYVSKGRGDSPTIYSVYLALKNPIDMDAKATPSEWMGAFNDDVYSIEDYHSGGTSNESWYRAAEEMVMDMSVPAYEGADIMQGGLRAMGYDGVTHIGGGWHDKSKGVKHRVYVAFESEQIKSAIGNTGAFDSSNPDIRFSRKQDPRVLAWAKDVQARKNKTDGVVLVPRPSVAMNAAGLYRPVVLDDNHLRHVFNKHPEVTPEHIAALPDMLQRPRIAFNEEGGPRLFIAERDQEGRPIAVALTNTKVSNGKEAMKVTEVSTAFGKVESARYVVQSLKAGKVSYIAKEEIDRLAGLMLVEPMPAKVGGSSSQGPTSPEAKSASSSPTTPLAGQVVTVLSDEGKVNLMVPDSALEDARGIAFSRKDLTGSKFALPPETQADALVREVQNDQLRWKQQMQALRDRGGVVNDQNDVYQAMERMTARAMNRTEDFYEKRVRPVLAEMRDLRITLEDLGEFLYASHAKERNTYIRSINPAFANAGYDEQAGSGMTDKEADEALAAFRQQPNIADLERFAKTFRQWSQDNLDGLVQGGLISQEEAAAFRTTYPNYVPLKGFAEGEESGSLGQGAGFSNAKKLFQSALGRRSKANNPAVYIIHGVAEGMLAREKANVGRYLERLIQDNPDDKLWTVGQPRLREVKGSTAIKFEVTLNGQAVGVFPSKRLATQYIRLMNLKGAIVDPVGGDPKVTKALAAYDPDTEVRFLRDGKEVRIQLNDDLLARSYNNRGAQDIGLFVRATSAINAFLREMWTQKNPVFPFVNVVRDIPSGALYATGEHGAAFAGRMVMNTPAAWKAMWQKAGNKLVTNGMDRWIDEYRKAGGGIGFRMVGDITSTMDKITRIQKELGDKTLLQALADGMPKEFGKRLLWKTYNNAVTEFIERVNITFENMTRLAIYKAAREKGLSVSEAARLSKNATVNFNRKGESTGTINGLYLFANASIQDVNKNFNSLMKSSHKGQVRTVLTGVAALGFMLAMMADDDDDLDSENMHATSVRFDVGDSKVNIPLPYGPIGFTYYLGRSAAKALQGEDLTLQSLRLASTLITHVSPVNPLPNADRADLKNAMVGITPTALELGMQLATNRNSFGQDMMPDYRPNDPDAYKAFRGTRGSVYAELSAAMNEGTGGTTRESGFIDVSPESLKGVVHFALGGTGKFVGDTASTGMDLLSGGPVNPAQVPVYNRFIKKEDVSTYRARFYRQASEAQDKLELFNKYTKDKNVEKRKELAPWRQLGVKANRAWDRMNALRDQELNVSRDDKLTTDQKAVKLKDLEAQQIKISEEYHKLYASKKVAP